MRRCTEAEHGVSAIADQVARAAAHAWRSRVAAVNRGSARSSGQGTGRSNGSSSSSGGGGRRGSGSAGSGSRNSIASSTGSGGLRRVSSHLSEGPITYNPTAQSNAGSYHSASRPGSAVGGGGRPGTAASLTAGLRGRQGGAANKWRQVPRGLMGVVLWCACGCERAEQVEALAAMPDPRRKGSGTSIESLADGLGTGVGTALAVDEAIANERRRTAAVVVQRIVRGHQGRMRTAEKLYAAEEEAAVEASSSGARRGSAQVSQEAGRRLVLGGSLQAIKVKHGCVVACP